ncbi:hypothetical protein ABZU25_14490 [Micromonospora sp. NPDC005215]|uniref:hypothetical protein n=1 Tax=Micromonospora sp. NPDC005215 TaxID=3157024 RepID=UPI0033B14B2B
MTTGRASGLSTVQGFYWHAFLLGDRPLARRLQQRAFDHPTAVGGVLVGMFVVVVGWLCPGRYHPAEISQFAERVSRHTGATYGVTADEVARIILRELGEPAGDEDVGPTHPGTAELAVIITATRDLELRPGDIDSMISSAEGLARKWGTDPTAYRPGFIMRWRFEIAEGRRYGLAARKRWSAERMGAFVSWIRDDSAG